MKSAEQRERQQQRGIILNAIPNGHDPTSFIGGVLSLETCHAMWMRGDLSYKMHDVQLEIREKIKFAVLNPLASEFVVLCTRRMGKSSGGVMMAIEDCLQNDEVRVYYCAESIKKAMDMLADQFKQIAKDAPPGLIIERPNENLWKVGNSELVAMGYETRSDSGFRGFPAYKAYIEESRDFRAMRYKKVIYGAVMPMLNDSPEPIIVHLTTPPDDPNHPFVTETMAKCRALGTLVVKTIWDNPRFTHDWKINEIARNGGLTSTYVRREYLAEIVPDGERVIIPTFDRNRHQRNVEISSERIIWMIWGDNAGKVDLSVYLLVAYDPETDTAHIVDERFFEVLVATEVKTREVMKMEKFHTLVEPTRIIDCSEELRNDMHLTYNFRTIPPIKVNKDERRQEVIDVFSEDRITVHERAKRTLETLQYAKMNESGTDFERTPQYGHADAVAAIIDGWNTRFRATSMGSARKTLERFETRNLEHKSSYVGITFENDEHPSFALAVDQDGRLLKFAPHRGDRQSRLDFVEEFLSDLKRPKVAYNTIGTGQAFRLELSFIVPENSVEVDLKGNVMDDFYYDLRDGVENRTFDVYENLSIFREFKAYRHRELGCYEVIEAMMLANHVLNRAREVGKYMLNGNMVKPDHIHYFSNVRALRSAGAIWFDKKTLLYAVAVKARIEGNYCWIEARRGIRSLANAVEVIARQGNVRKLAIPSSIRDEVEAQLIACGLYLEMRLFEYDIKPDATNIVEGFLEGREAFSIDGGCSDALEQALTYPAEICSQDLLCAGHLINLALTVL